MRLYVGNKNYSSWSLRAGLLIAQAGIQHEQIVLLFSDLGPNSKFKREIGSVTPAGRVPVLVDGDVVVWDSLAICEYIAERFPEKQLWPSDRAARARARSLCAEMHSGFVNIRNLFPMNIELHAPEIGPRVLAQYPEARTELARLDAILAGELARSGTLGGGSGTLARATVPGDRQSPALRGGSGGPMLFGEFGIADAYFAPIASRIRTYGLPVSDVSAAWVERVFELPAMQAWVRDALVERDWVALNEPYRAQPTSG
jgi:glutathione S-transferase